MGLADGRPLLLYKEQIDILVLTAQIECVQLNSKYSTARHKKRVSNSPQAGTIVYLAAITCNIFF